MIDIKTRKYFKAGGLYLIGNIFDKAVAFLTVPIFTRLLSTTDYGITNTYLSWVSITTVIITLSLSNSIRTAIVDFKDDINGYISSIFFLGTISATVISGIILILRFLGIIKFSYELIILCCIQAYSVSIIQGIQLKYMMQLEYLKRTILQCIPNLLIIFLSILFIKSMGSKLYLGRIYPYILVNVVIAVGLVFSYFIKEKKFVDIKYWKYAWMFSIPIIFHSLSVAILSQSDRTMITALYSSSETGIYSLAYQFGSVPLVLTTTFENIWIPWFTKKMQRGKKTEINKMAVPYISFVAIICSGIMLVAPELLKMMTVKEYYSAIYMISPVVAATFFMFLASVPLDLEYYMKKTKGIALNTVVAATINIVLNFILIPIYGGVAAAFTTLISYIVSFLMHHFVARKLDSELFKLKIYIIPICIVIFFTIITNILMEYIFIRWGIGVFLGVILIWSGSRLIKLKDK